MKSFKQLAKSYALKFENSNGDFEQDLPDEYFECEDIVHVHNPHKIFDLVVALVQASKYITEQHLRFRWLTYIVAGIPEVLLANHGKEVIDLFVKQMAKDKLFLLMCMGIWPLGDSNLKNGIWLKFQDNLNFYLIQHKSSKLVKVFKEFLACSS